jgi:uncharacterized hydrophobic protein (TIGR00271 family)
VRVADDGVMIHLRLIVMPSLGARVLEELLAHPGVAHVAILRGASAKPPGDVVMCEVVRESANDVIEWLQDQGVHRSGAIVVESLEAVVSDEAARAEVRAPGQAADALIWEEIEARARDDGLLTTSFLVFMVIAALIAGIGILLDAPILVVGAMVVGPEYGPVSALCIAAARRRPAAASRAAGTLAVGLAVASVSAVVGTLAFRAIGLAPGGYTISDRQLTAFISHPDGMAAVVAVLAGIVGMLSLTEARSGALIGVLVSVTTIPAAANIGVAASYLSWSEVGGAALQLALNVAGLVVAGVLTLVVQAKATGARSRATASAAGRRGPAAPAGGTVAGR